MGFTFPLQLNPILMYSNTAQAFFPSISYFSLFVQKITETRICLVFLFSFFFLSTGERGKSPLAFETGGPAKLKEKFSNFRQRKKRKYTHCIMRVAQVSAFSDLIN